MNEILKKQIWRKLETLPEDKVYAVLDYIDFLESEYADRRTTRGPAPFQRFAEAVQTGMRRTKVPAAAVRETMKVLGTTDRVLESFRQAGREFLAEMEAGRAEPPPRQGEESEPPERREIVVE